MQKLTVAAFAALFAAVCLAPLAGHAETLKGTVNNDTGEDGVIYINGHTTQLNLSQTKTEQFVALDGANVILQGKYEKDGTFTVDVSKPMVVEGKVLKNSRLEVYNDPTYPDANTDIKARFKGKEPAVGEMIWAVARFSGSASILNVSKFNNVARGADTAGGSTSTTESSSSGVGTTR